MLVFFIFNSNITVLAENLNLLPRIFIVMLVEFPHLITLTHIQKKKKQFKTFINTEKDENRRSDRRTRS